METHVTHRSFFIPFARSTKLFYMVNVKPKGPVPVGALEWRIKEDVPTNLRAVKVASEKLPWDCEQDQAALAGGHISLFISEESFGDVTFTTTCRKLLHKISALFCELTYSLFFDSLPVQPLLPGVGNNKLA